MSEKMPTEHVHGKYSMKQPRLTKKQDQHGAVKYECLIEVYNVDTGKVEFECSAAAADEVKASLLAVDQGLEFLKHVSDNEKSG
jgi:hypothetical protein